MSKFNTCPFCGRIPKPISKAVFYECEAKHGVAMIMVECECGAQFHDYTFDEIDYDKRLEILADKWNRRATDESDQPTPDV